MRQFMYGVVVAVLMSGPGVRDAMAQRTPRQIDSAPGDSLAVAASVPLGDRADLDTTTAPCQDFYQYATGSWYRRMAALDSTQRDWHAGIEIYSETRAFPFFSPPVMHLWTGPPAVLPYEELRKLVAQSPRLAGTTTDPTLRAVGYFYGSCLADSSGTAAGLVGDTARARYCFHTTRQYLDRALFELFMEHIWPPAARMASSQLAANVMGAVVARARASKALSASRRQELITRFGQADFYLSSARIEKMSRGGKSLDALALQQLWRSAPRRPAGRRGPSGMVFTGPKVERTWVYRNYAKVTLSPTAFRENVARLTAAPDTVPLPILPDSTPVLDALEQGGQFATARHEGTRILWGLTLPQLVPPLAEGQIDLGVWYGSLWMTGHEMSEQAWMAWMGWDGSLPTTASPAERAAFAQEQFQGQMPFYDHHTAFDFGGVTIFHDAFQRARSTWPATKIDGFTPEQRFFLGTAWGGRGGEPSYTISGDLGRWRTTVNGSLSALPTFARAFGCKAQAPMAGGQQWYQSPFQHLVLSAEQRQALAQQYEGLLHNLLKGLAITLTPEQDSAFAQRRQQYAAQRRALFGEPGRAGEVGTTVAMFHLLGQELGEARAILPPTQQAKVDSAAGHMTLPPDERAYLTIPGVTP